MDISAGGVLDGVMMVMIIIVVIGFVFVVGGMIGVGMSRISRHNRQATYNRRRRSGRKTATKRD